MLHHRSVLLLTSGAALWAQTFSFLPGTVYPAGSSPMALAQGDFNGDGNLDLAVGNASSQNISIFLGNGQGSFTAGATVAIPGCEVAFLRAGIFIRKSPTALLAACQGQKTLWVVPTTGAAVSTALPSALAGPQTVAVADFNNDGVPDVAMGFSDGSVGLMTGKGDGSFQAPTPIVAAGGSPCTAVLVADFNFDGNQDVAVAGGTAVSVYLGNGDGTFQAPSPLTLAANVTAAVAADVNGDALPDLVVTSASQLSVYLGKGDGTFRAAFTAPESQPPAGLLAADLRDTGHPDLVETVGAASALTVQARAGNGDGTFGAPVPVAFPPGLEPSPNGMLPGFWSAGAPIGLAFAALPGDLAVILNGSAATPSLTVTPGQLQFTYVAGSAQPGGQTAAVGNAGSGTLNWTASSSASWLAISPSSGIGAAELSVVVLPAGLAPNTYTGTVKVAAAGGSPQSITVTLTVAASTSVPVISAVVNGASFQPGFESGSWVTITGLNLSNTNPGRTWTGSEIVNGNLPQVLDGTSVSIDGKAAYVYYISPNQLNVQAPGDTAIGPVSVAVTNNGQTSTAFSAQLAAYSPAFFLYPNTSYAIASHFPDYALVGNPGAIAGTVAAHAGDILILWATGFGATSPPTPAGVVVTGAPGDAVMPVVTVAGTPVNVVSSGLAPGSAGLYQIAIQLPAAMASGVASIQASLPGATSPSGVSIYVQ